MLLWVWQRRNQVQVCCYADLCDRFDTLYAVGLARSLFGWLGSPSGAARCAALSPGPAASSPAVKSSDGNDGGGGGGASASASPLSAGHAALAAWCLRDVAEARASRVVTRGSAGGSDGLGGNGGSIHGSAGYGGVTHGSAGAGDTAARGPRSAEPYSLRHAVHHVGRWAADRAMAGDHAGEAEKGIGMGLGERGFG